MFDRSGNFEIEFQGVTRNLYKRLLPTGDLSQKVHQTVQLFTRDPLDFRVWAILVRGAAIPLQPSVQGGEGRLGLDVWLGARQNQETRVEVRTETA